MKENYYQESALQKNLSDFQLDNWPIKMDQLRDKFNELCKKYHPDVNKEVGSVKKYVRINKSYEYLQNLLLNEKYEEVETPFNLEPLKPEFIEPIKEEVLEIGSNIYNNTIDEELLEYTIKINLLELFSLWTLDKPYEKRIKYVYFKKCDCEELCKDCKGNCSNNRICRSCSNQGWVHYCDKCNGSGQINLQDNLNIKIAKNYLAKETYQVQNKGNFINDIERGPLLIKIKYTGLFQRKDNFFDYYIGVKSRDLEGGFMDIPFLNQTSYKCEFYKFKHFPWTIDVSPFFSSIFLKGKSINVRLYFYYIHV